ncbi:hypothetical protein YC2023_099808 [Brassica napus]
MDSQQVRLDSLEDLLDVMAVGNPVMQRMLSERRAALGMPPRDPQESDPTRMLNSRPTRTNPYCKKLPAAYAPADACTKPNFDVSSLAVADRSAARSKSNNGQTYLIFTSGPP